MENYNYLMVEFYGEDEKICEIYHNLEEICEILKIHKATLYRNYDEKMTCYKIKKKKCMYFIKKI